MQISIKWINELVDINLIKLEDLIDKLTLGGFEVEDIFEVNISNHKETVLEISATANRSDSLSMYGITSEISTLLNQPLKISNYRKVNSEWKEQIEKKQKFDLKNENCSTFISIIVENLTNLTVPIWIKQKIQSSGLVPANNLSDFQTYILLETGYPFEFYDFDQICSQLDDTNFLVSIETAETDEKFNASNNFEYILDSSILKVSANKLPIGIAGTIAEKTFSISEQTKTLFIEGSIFSAAKIRQQSRKLGLRTDRSARYEKSIRNTYLIDSLYRLISLLRISNPDLVCKIHNYSKVLESPREPILLRYSTVHEILGPIKKSGDSNSNLIERALIQNYLKRLNFDYQYNKINSTWLITIPHSRIEDITREIDIIEEIGRLHGFDNFQTILLPIKFIGSKDSHYNTRIKVTNCLLNLGLSEFLNYSLVSNKKILQNDIKLINPQLNDYSTLRSTLLANLIKIASENLNQKNVPIEGFEYGHIFYSNEGKNFQEKEYVSGLFGGVKKKLSWETKNFPMGWFEAKGKIEQFFQHLNIETFYYKCSLSDLESYHFLHPYRSATIYSKNNNYLGIFGQINPIIANEFNISSEFYLFEFDIQTIDYCLKNNKLILYKSYSLYPKIIKDLSFIVSNNIKFEQIQKLLYLNGTELLSQINLLDEFRGPSIPKNSTSLCLQLIFQSNEKTLETKKIEEILQKLKLVLTEILQAKIRN